MEETTHDSSSSSSRKSEEKCPPAGGIKMKIGGFKTGQLPQTIRCSNPTGTQWG